MSAWLPDLNGWPSFFNDSLHPSFSTPAWHHPTLLIIYMHDFEFVSWDGSQLCLHGTPKVSQSTVSHFAMTYSTSFPVPSFQLLLSPQSEFPFDEVFPYRTHQLIFDHFPVTDCWLFRIDSDSWFCCYVVFCDTASGRNPTSIVVLQETLQRLYLNKASTLDYFV